MALILEKVHCILWRSSGITDLTPASAAATPESWPPLAPLQQSVATPNADEKRDAAPRRKTLHPFIFQEFADAEDMIGIADSNAALHAVRGSHDHRHTLRQKRPVSVP